MGNTSFELIHRDTKEMIKSFNSLKECVKYIKLTINDAREYVVAELQYGKKVNDCWAFYLIETYKNLDKMPLYLSDC